MLWEGPILKIPFYYRTRNEFCKVFDYVEAVNAELRKSSKFRNRRLLSIYTRYLSNDNKTWDMKIPKERVGEKKYIGIVVGNKHRMKMCNICPSEFVESSGLELVPNVDGETKYDGEKTTHPVMLKTHSEFKTITSVFNKRYGHGSWRIVGPKKLQHILRQIEPKPDVMPGGFTFNFGDTEQDMYVERYPGGVPVTIVVNEPQANITKQLFKVVLKG